METDRRAQSSQHLRAENCGGSKDEQLLEIQSKYMSGVLQGASRTCVKRQFFEGFGHFERFERL